MRLVPQTYLWHPFVLPSDAPALNCLVPLGMLVFSGLVAELLIFSGRFLVDVFALLTALLTALLAFYGRFLAVFARLLVFYGRLLAAAAVAPVAFFVQLLVFCGQCHFDVVALALGLAG